jgi:hypothetical protein
MPSRSKKPSVIMSLTKGAIAVALAGLLVAAGAWEERRELLGKAAADTRIVAAIAVYQCEVLKGLFIIPQHAKPEWHSTEEVIPLDFYKPSLILAINGMVKFTVPCPKTGDTLARVE